MSRTPGLSTRSGPLPVLAKQETRLLPHFYRAAPRTLRYPVATVLGAGLTALASAIAESIPDALPAAQSIEFVLSVTGGCAVFLFLIAMMVMPVEDTRHCRSLVRTGAALSTAYGLAVSLPILLFAHFLPDWVFTHFADTWIATWAPYACVSLGAVMATGMAPSVIVGWAISARFGAFLRDSLMFVWTDIEPRAYAWWSVALLAPALGGVLAWTPIVGLFVPVFLAHAISSFVKDSLRLEHPAELTSRGELQ